MVDGGRVVCISTIGTGPECSGGNLLFRQQRRPWSNFAGRLRKRLRRVALPSMWFRQALRRPKRCLAFRIMGSDARRDFIEMTPLHRLGQPEEIADVISFLVGEQGRWINRQNIAADGGIISR